VSVETVIDRSLERLPLLGRWYETPDGRKKVRYALVSVVAVPVGSVAVFCFGLAIPGNAALPALLGNSVGAVPSYVLNRYWVWGKTGKNHLVKEILPFWGITVVGILFSLFVAHLAGGYTKHHHIAGAGRSAILVVANVTGFAVLWVATYVLFNKVLFVVRHHDVSGPA
jgi:putative flippase GtrA